MATKPVKSKLQNNSSTWEQAEFIQRELTIEEQSACKFWDYTEVQAFLDMIALSSDGYKVTFRYDEYNSCHACWLLPPKDHQDNAGLILTGRGSVPFKAFKQAMYKHHVLFSGVWESEGGRRGGREIDD